MSTILVVDDSAVCRVPMARWLRSEGYETKTACNGLEALEALDEDNLSLIVLDLAMPVMDGLTFLSRLHDHPRWNSLPVIVVSGEFSGPLERAKELGAREVFVKTKFSPDQLGASIRRHVGA